MAGILDAASQSAYTDPDGGEWTYYRDHDDPSVFYVMPVPAFSTQSGVPQFHLTEYVDAKGSFLSAQLQLATLLGVPDTVARGVAGALRQQGVAAPRAQAMPFIDVEDGGAADPNRAFLSYADAGGTVSRSVQTVPSLGGSQTAVFHVDDLAEGEARFLRAYFGGDPNAGRAQVVYRLTAWARLGPLTARVRFDARAAYDYQRTYRWVR